MDCGTLARNPDPDFPFSSSTVSNGGTSILFSMGRISSGFTDVRLELTAPLTDAGGTIPLIPGSDGSSGPEFVIGPGSATWYDAGFGHGLFFPFTDGTITASPEPGCGSYVALLMLALAGIQGCKHWRRKLFVGVRRQTSNTDAHEYKGYFVLLRLPVLWRKKPNSSRTSG